MNSKDDFLQLFCFIFSTVTLVRLAFHKFHKIIYMTGRRNGSPASLPISPRSVPDNEDFFYLSDWHAQKACGIRAQVGVLSFMLTKATYS